MAEHKRATHMENLTFLPVSIRMGHIVVIGGGRVATHKVSILLRYTADIRIVGTSISDELKQSGLPYEERDATPDDLTGAHIAFICTGDHALNAAMKQEAERRHVIASVCDSPDLCDFTSPAICAVGDGVTVAVASDGRDVRRSIRIRDRIKKLIDDGILQTD